MSSGLKCCSNYAVVPVEPPPSQEMMTANTTAMSWYGTPMNKLG